MYFFYTGCGKLADRKRAKGVRFRRVEDEGAGGRERDFDGGIGLWVRG